jgi:hypothetical protein
VLQIELSFLLAGPTSADDAHRLLTAFCVDDQDEPPTNGTDGDEVFFQLGVLAVEEFEKIDARGEQLLGLPEGDAVLCKVELLFLPVPFEPYLREG